MDGVSAAATVRRFRIDGGLLLLDTSSNSLFAFNDTARHVWDLLATPQSDEALVTTFAAWWGISPARAQADVSSILAQWREFGLLAGNEQQAVPPPPMPAATTVDRATTEWTCTIRGTAFDFAIGDDDLAPKIRSLFHHLETPHARTQTRVEVAPTANGETIVTVDGIERIRTDDAGQVIGALYQAMLEHIHPDAAWLALLHGAAVARNGAGVGLAGPSGSGKSTLAAALLNSGFDYLADDMIALTAPDGMVRSWPLPLSIKPGSVDVIAARHPALAQAPVYRTKGLDARLLIPPAGVWDAAPVRLRTLAFPHFAAGAAADLQRISVFDAIERLLADRVWLGHPITEARVNALLDWLNDTPAFAVTYGDLDDGVRLIGSIAA